MQKQRLNTAIWTISLSLITLLVISCVPRQANLDTSSFSSHHQLGDCEEKLGFSYNTANRSWVYYSKNWQFAKLDIASFEQVTDSMLTSIDFDKTPFHDLPDNRLNIGKNEFVAAKHASRIHNYYVFTLVDQVYEKVKLDHQVYRIHSDRYYRLDAVGQLRQCLRYSDVQTLKEATESGINIDTCAKFLQVTMTPLMVAMSSKDTLLFNTLLDLGANVDQVCRGNRTALMKAAGESNDYYFRQLLSRNANINMTDDEGRSVRDYIEYYGNLRLLELLD